MKWFERVLWWLAAHDRWLLIFTVKQTGTAWMARIADGAGWETSFVSRQDAVYKVLRRFIDR